MARIGAQLHRIIASAITALGFELVGVEQLHMGHGLLLRVYIDHTEGIDVEDCAEASRQISAVLDVEDPIRGGYTLEVSSPGLNRPLFTAEQFARYSGSLAEIRMRSPQDGRRKFKGRICAVRDGMVMMMGDGVEYALMLDGIEKANLIHEW